MIISFVRGRLFLVLSAIGLMVFWIIPSIYTAPHMDELYGYITIQGSDATQSVIEIIRRSFSSERLTYFLNVQGRIVPFSSWVYQLGYWAVTNLALTLGVPLILAIAIYKFVLLCAIFLTMRFWLKLLVGSKNSEFAGRWATDVSLFAGLIFVIGIRIDTPNSNGFITYASLTYGPLIYLFLIPVCIARLLRINTRLATAVALGSAVAIGFVLAFSYELNYLSAIGIFLTLFVLDKDRYHLSKVAAIVFGSTFFASLLINRLLVTNACSQNECYSGTSVKLGSDFGRALFNNFLGTLPLRHELYPNKNIQKLESYKSFMNQNYAVWILASLLTMYVAYILLRQSIQISSNFNSDGFIKFGIICFLIYSLTVVATSLSPIAQERLVSGIPYRGYLISWVAFILFLTILITSILQNQSARHQHFSVLFIAGIIGLVAVYLRPYSNAAIQGDVKQFESSSVGVVYSEFLDPNLTSSGIELRCNLLKELNTSRIHEAIKININRPFIKIYGYPFCSEK